MDSIKGQPQLSARQKEILYAFDVIHTYGEDLQLEVLPARLRLCCVSVTTSCPRCQSVTALSLPIHGMGWGISGMGCWS